MQQPQPAQTAAKPGHDLDAARTLRFLEADPVAADLSFEDMAVRRGEAPP